VFDIARVFEDIFSGVNLTRDIMTLVPGIGRMHA